MNRRNIVIRLGVASLALAVLAAGCSQSGDESGVGSGTAVPLSGGTASASLGLGAGGATTTQMSVQEQSPGSSAVIPATTRGCGGIVRLGCVPRGSNGGTTTTVVVSLPSVEAKVGVVLSERVVESIDVAIDACADLYDLGCGEAVRDVCFQLRSGSGFEEPVSSSGGGIVLAEDDQFDICDFS